MGAETAAAAAQRLGAVGRIFSDDLTDLGHAAGRAGKQAGLGVARQLGVLRHMGRRGVRLSARYDVESGGRVIVVKLTPPGPWVLVEQGAGPHAINPRRRRKTATGRPSAVLGAGFGHPVGRGVVTGARARARGGIRTAFARARPAIVDAWHDAELARIRRIYG